MIFYDGHIHKKSLEAGGFIIGLEKKYDKKTLSNTEALLFHSVEEKYISFYQVTKAEIDSLIGHGYLKYHARLEGYSPDEVVHSIRINQPRAVIIDTLNEPYWVPYDYWKIAQIFPETPIILAHAGGYAVNEYIKICNIQKNIWIDFSLTHSVLGKYGEEDGLSIIHQAICFSLKHTFRNRILLGSDYPFYDQNEVLKYYGANIGMLNTNFETLLKMIK